MFCFTKSLKEDFLICKCNVGLLQFPVIDSLQQNDNSLCNNYGENMREITREKNKEKQTLFLFAVAAEFSATSTWQRNGNVAGFFFFAD